MKILWLNFKLKTEEVTIYNIRKRILSLHKLIIVHQSKYVEIIKSFKMILVI